MWLQQILNKSPKNYLITLFVQVEEDTWSELVSVIGLKGSMMSETGRISGRHEAPSTNLWLDGSDFFLSTH